MKKAKSQISASFSKHATTYNQYAQLQKKSAVFLQTALLGQRDQLPQGPVLEVGCGSGHLSRMVIPMFSNRHFTLMDISPGMLERCRKELCHDKVDSSKILFMTQDAENIKEKERFALIYSGLTLQWFSDMFRGIERLINALKPGGVLVCSFLAEGSFLEWRNWYKKCGLKQTVNPLPSCDTIANFFGEENYDAQVLSRDIQLKYSHPLDFFISLKKTGVAVNISGLRNNPAQLRRCLKAWHQSEPQGIYITASVCYVTVVAR